jgi:colicin import membrane protein
MIRKHENSVSWKAGVLSFLVHALLVAGLLISFNWKAAHSIPNVTEVDLWDKLPAPPAPKVDPVPSTPEVKEEPKPEPKPIIEEKPREEEPKVDIELEKKKQELAEKEHQLELRKQKEKVLEEKKKEAERERQEKLDQLKRLSREDALKTPSKNDDIKKQLHKEILSEEKGESDKLASAANASLRDQYIAKIQAKIRGNVNKTLCGDGDPELRFKIDLLPTGELSGSPLLTKSSGNSACDAAVERAIMASQPLPLPTEPSVRAEFRNMNLKFHPNGD